MSNIYLKSATDKAATDKAATDKGPDGMTYLGRTLLVCVCCIIFMFILSILFIVYNSNKNVE